MVNARNAAATKLEQEMRRGIVVLAVLSRLRQPEYGYSLRQALLERGMPIEEGTLYPLLRRLEEQGLLTSEWRLDEGPPRRYYRLSVEGLAHYDALKVTWRDLVATADRLLD
jgi:DNA-binding PadR family transcriptional regulator